MIPLLPQNDPQPDQRQQALARSRVEYQFTYTGFSPCARAASVPERDGFAVKWLLEAGERTLKVVENHIGIEAAQGNAGKSLRDLFLLSLVSKAATEIDGLIKVVEQALSDTGDPGGFTSIDAYASLFRDIALPGISADWKTDATFAHMRVGGPNPVMLQSISRLDPRLTITEAMYGQAMPGDTLAAALAEGRMFLTDYAPLQGIVNGTYPGPQKYSHAPLGLFALDRTTRQLAPVAVQCKQEPGLDNPVFVPDGSVDWLLARNVLEVADGNYHQAITHLGRTHMFIEPFVVTTQRQLAANHPLGILLRPHFQGTLAINKSAVETLAAPGGSVDELLAGTIETTVAASANGMQSYRVDEAMLPRALAARGVADASVLPNYPYRDDALLYWRAIRAWAEAYLRIYYQSDADVAGDPELQAWYRELASTDGGRVAGLAIGDATNTLNYLVDVTTLVIFTASVQHAAVNFPQYDLMTYVPNLPLACYRPAPTKRTGATEADYLAMLSPRRPAERQLSLGYLLGTLHYGQLGQYESSAFADERVKGPLAAFQQALASIGAKIDDRNLSRRPYTFLTATGVPQSINI